MSDGLVSKKMIVDAIEESHCRNDAINILVKKSGCSIEDAIELIDAWVMYICLKEADNSHNN